MPVRLFSGLLFGEAMHWADVLAEELLDRGDEHTLATGITPSGSIHVGNLREVLTTEAVHRALQDQGGSSRLVYVADSYDPLRKVSPFLEDHPEVDYSEHVGKPISEVPAPGGEHASFAHEFLEPFLGALEELGITPEVRLAHEMYESGAYRDNIQTALAHRAEIREILNDVAGRDLGPEWVPFTPRCPDCGRLNQTEVLASEDAADPTDAEDAGEVELVIQCEACGFEGSIDALEPGAGKLPWRVDWPARWSFLGVTFEAFGKDHAASGGSWDTAVPIAEQVFGIEPPNHTVYEWIHVEGEGAMSSSKGTGIAAEDVLEVTPPEVLRFFFMRYKPNKHVEFDPGEGLLGLVDDYDRALRELEEEDESAELRHPGRVLELSQPSGRMPEHPGQTVSMRHLARLVDLYEDTEEVLASVRRSGHISEITEDEEDLLRSRIEHTRAWLSTFAPDDAQLRLPETPPPVELVYALDAFRKPAPSLIANEPGQLRSRAHELTASLDQAPHVASQTPGPPEELGLVALWRGLDQLEAVTIEDNPAPRPRDLAEELQGLFDGTEPERIQREGDDAVLTPLVLHLIRATHRPAVARDPRELVDRIERWVEATGAGRPGSLPERDDLELLVEALSQAAESTLVDNWGRSPEALGELTEQAANVLAESELAACSPGAVSLPRLHLRDMLLARLLMERARGGLAMYRECIRDADWEAEAIQSCVYDTAEETGLATGDAFSLVYLAVLDQQRGPRLGSFLAGLDREWVTDRLAALTGP